MIIAFTYYAPINLEQFAAHPTIHPFATLTVLLLYFILPTKLEQYFLANELVPLELKIISISITRAKSCVNFVILRDRCC